MSTLKNFKAYLTEEARTFHGIFILGKSASGKSGLARTLSSLYHLPIVDSDHIYEPLLLKHRLPLDFSKHNAEQTALAKKLRSDAIEASRKEWKGYAARGLSFIYTGLGNQIYWVQSIIDKYTEMGFQCHIIFMDVSAEEAKKRNQQRERKVPEKIIDLHSKTSHDEFIDHYIEIVGKNNFMYINTDDGYDTGEIVDTVDEWVR